MNNVSEAVLINHLMTVCKMASSKAKDNIAYFKKQLFLEFWKLCIDTMKEATNLGMKLKILGQEGTKIFFPRIAFLIGDDPAQHDVASIKCGSKFSIHAHELMTSMITILENLTVNFRITYDSLRLVI